MGYLQHARGPRIARCGASLENVTGITNRRASRLCLRPLLLFSLLGRPEHRLSDPMNDRGGQLEHSRLLGALRAHSNGNPTVAGEGIGQDVEIFSVDSDVLRGGIPELSNARTNFGGRETRLAGNHEILVSGGKKDPPSNTGLFNTTSRIGTVTVVTGHPHQQPLY